MVEADPKAGNLFERYRPDAPAKLDKGKWRCKACDVWLPMSRRESHGVTKKHQANLEK